VCSWPHAGFEQWLSIFRAENDMDDDQCERLWHDWVGLSALSFLKIRVPRASQFRSSSETAAP
jgi:hypothetical protein